jgi:hypothetical protein
MDPATLATLAVGALARYAGSKVVSLAGRATDEAVDDRLDRLYEIVRTSLRRDRLGERTLRDLEGDPDDSRKQRRLEMALEGMIEDDAKFARKLETILNDLANRPPTSGIVMRDVGPVALGGDVTMKGRNVAGRDLRIGGPEQR